MKKLWKTIKHQTLITLVPILGLLYLYIVGKTSRTIEIGNESVDTLRARYPHLIFAAWHEHILLESWILRRQGITGLVSQSRDGEYFNRLIHYLGFRTARGSSSRGGIRGLLKLVRVLKNDGDVGITADGPRGPARECKPGVITLAKRSGMPIVPIAASTNRFKRVKSWDRTIVPLPFSTLTLIYGDPIFIPEDLNKDEIPEYQQQVKQALDGLIAATEKPHFYREKT